MDGETNKLNPTNIVFLLQMRTVWVYRSQAVRLTRPYCHYSHPHIYLDHSPDPLERLRPAERASYTTRHGAEGDQLHGCMQGTRVQIIADLEAWARDETAPKVYWLNGHLGTGKTSIAHSLRASQRAPDAWSKFLLFSVRVTGCNPHHSYYRHHACSIQPSDTVSNLRDSSR